MAEPVQRKISLPAGGRGYHLNKEGDMAKVLDRPVEKVVHKTEPSRIDAIEKLTILNGTLVEKITALSSELDSLKSRLDLVAGRLGL